MTSYNFLVVSFQAVEGLHEFKSRGFKHGT